MKRSPLTRKTPMVRTAMKRPSFNQHMADVAANGKLLLKGSFRRALTAARKAAEDKAQNRPAQRSGPKRMSSARAQQRQQYNRQKPAYLAAHPYCQITIAVLGLDEADVIKHHGRYVNPGRRDKIFTIPLATELHHRNKANGSRLINFDYIMSACPAAHDYEEAHKDEAREIGLLCPINCKPDGTMPDGTKQPTTPELLAERNQQKSPCTPL